MYLDFFLDCSFWNILGEVACKRVRVFVFDELAFGILDVLLDPLFDMLLGVTHVAFFGNQACSLVDDDGVPAFSHVAGPASVL